ncbi:aspartate--ammonia ligase [Candidatus Margulisiibacteriota bacterium]
MAEAQINLFLNGRLRVPVNYNSTLNLRETEKAIKYVKDLFQKKLANALNLSRVSAPIAVLNDTGLNDHLNGIERPASFEVKELKKTAEIVQSLAKWKRAALADYGFQPGEGLYTDMNAIRPDEDLSTFHSIYVDQWDWERVLTRGDRNLDFLKGIVNNIYQVMRQAEQETCASFPSLPKPYLPEDIFFIHAEELDEKYPGLTSKERENAICKEKGAVFLIGIGAPLKDGQPHDGRASDYDDWITETGNGKKGLNGDILLWNPILECAFEISSMGIRVDKEALLKQVEIRNESDKVKLPFHQRLLNDELPLTIGGGIGQSRLCMLLLRKAHVGEVQSGIWSEKIKSICSHNNIFLL